MGNLCSEHIHCTASEHTVPEEGLRVKVPFIRPLGSTDSPFRAVLAAATLQNPYMFLGPWSVFAKGARPQSLLGIAVTAKEPPVLPAEPGRAHSV